MVGGARLVAASAIGVASMVASCSLMLDSDYSDGDGEEAEGGGLEDAHKERPTAPPDVLRPEPLHDAGASDATDSGGGAPLCVSGPTRFCDDFDDGPPGARWTGATKSGGEVGFDGVGRSLPNALRTTTTELDGSAYLYRRFSERPLALRCEVNVKLVTSSDIGTFQILTIISDGLDGSSAIYLRSRPDHVCFGEDRYWQGKDLYRCTNLDVEPPVGSWFRMSVVVTPTTAKLELGGASIVLNDIPPLAVRELRLGQTWTDDVPSSEILFDDVDCSLEFE